MSMWCIFDCISLWALALPSSSFIPSTLNDFRKSYFVITIINHIYLNHNHVSSSIHIHLFIIHSTIFFWMRQGRGRRALLFAKQKRLFLSRVSKLGQGPIRSSPKYDLSPCLDFDNGAWWTTPCPYYWWGGRSVQLAMWWWTELGLTGLVLGLGGMGTKGLLINEGRTKSRIDKTKERLKWRHQGALHKMGKL